MAPFSNPSQLSTVSSADNNMAHPAPFRQYPGRPPQGPPMQDPYPPRNNASRQDTAPPGPVYPREQYYDGEQRNVYDQRPPPSRGPQPPQSRRPSQPREDLDDHRPPPPHDSYRLVPPSPRRPRPQIQELDLASPHDWRPPGRRPGAEDHGAVVSPVYDARFEGDDRRRAYPPPKKSPVGRGEPMPTMQFNINGGQVPSRTKSAPPDDPRNWSSGAQPPVPRMQDTYGDRRGGGPGGRGAPPRSRRGGIPPQQLYDRPVEFRRRTPPEMYPPQEARRRTPPEMYPPQEPRRWTPPEMYPPQAHERVLPPDVYAQQHERIPPPPRSNTVPPPNPMYDDRGPPQQRRFEGPPPSRGRPIDERGYFPDQRDPPRRRNENVDDLLDNYIEELNLPVENYASPTQNDPQPRGAPPWSEAQYTAPDRRNMIQQIPPPGPGRLPRSQTEPMGFNPRQPPPDLIRGVQSVDLYDEPAESTRTRSPNKLHKSPPRTQPVIVGVQPQQIVSSTGKVHDPNALPAFPSRLTVESPASDHRTSQGSGSDPPASVLARQSNPPPKPKLTFALLEECRRDARESPNDPAIQLDLAKALCEAGTVLALESGMGDPKRVAKSRENYFTEGMKLLKKLASTVPPHQHNTDSRALQG
jgi:hypothetical protein